MYIWCKFLIITCKNLENILKPRFLIVFMPLFGVKIHVKRFQEAFDVLTVLYKIKVNSSTSCNISSDLPCFSIQHCVII